MLSSSTSHPPLPLSATRHFFSLSFIKIFSLNHKARLLSWNKSKLPNCLWARYSVSSFNKKKLVFLSFSGIKLAKPLSLQQRSVSYFSYFIETEILVLRSTPEVTCQNNFKSVTPHPDKARIWSRTKQKTQTNSVVRTSFNSFLWNHGIFLQSRLGATDNDSLLNWGNKSYII